MLGKENEELLRLTRGQQEEIKTLRRLNVTYERRWQFFGKDISCAITVPATGSPTVKLDGNWTHGFVREAFAALAQAVRRQMVENRLKIERGQKINNDKKGQTSDNSSTEAENPPPAVGAEKEVTDE